MNDDSCMSSPSAPIPWDQTSGHGLTIEEARCADNFVAIQSGGVQAPSDH